MLLRSPPIAVSSPSGPAGNHIQPWFTAVLTRNLSAGERPPISQPAIMMEAGVLPVPPGLLGSLLSAISYFTVMPRFVAATTA